MDECVCTSVLADVLTCIWCGMCVTCCCSDDQVEIDTQEMQFPVISRKEDA